MRILVTGGAGFVGTNLIKRLLKDGHKVVSFDNYSSGLKENHQEGCEYIEMEVRNPFEDWLENFDMIFHLSAMARIQPSFEDPRWVIENNFNSTINVLEFARRKNIDVIYAGSSSVHHGLYGSPYAWSKHGGEQMCKLYSEVYDMNTSICRFYNVYGPHQIEEGEFATVIGIFEKQHRDGKPLTIVGDGEQRRDFTHIDDIVEGLIKVFRGMNGEIDMRFSGQIFELGRGENYSINEIADMFGGDKEYIEKRKGEYPQTLCDDKDTMELLDWKPTKNLKDYIESVR